MLDLESLFKLSYGMCLLSSKKDDKFNSCIVNTVFQVTPEPPMIAVSINMQCLTHKYVADSGVFTVSILSQDAPLSFIRKFGFMSGKSTDKLEQMNYKIGQTGVPVVLDNAVGFIEAEVVQSVDVLTHTLFIARIVAAETLDNKKEPMTYAYYRDIKQGKTPKTAATYIDTKPEVNLSEGAKGMKKYRCIICGYIYDPAIGDPGNGVKAGTAFENLPPGWVCPECGAGKDQFEPV